MNTAEQVYQNTLVLPESLALEILHFSEFLKLKQSLIPSAKQISSDGSSVELQERAVHLKTEDMRVFLQTLENPPKANDALKGAAKENVTKSRDLRNRLKNYPVGHRTSAEIDAQISALRNEWK